MTVISNSFNFKANRSMDMQYSVITWLILFSYLFLLALLFGMRVQIGDVIFLKHAKLSVLLFLTKSEPQHYS